MQKIIQYPATFSLIFINALIFGLIASGIWVWTEESIYANYFALHKSNLFGFRTTDFFHPIQLLTYTFTNNDWWGVLLNSWSLYVFGSAIESIVGSKKFLYLYFFCTFLTGLFLAFLAPSSIPVIGGGYVLMSLFFCYAYCFPKQKIEFFVPFPVGLEARTWIWVFGSLSLLMAFLDWQYPTDYWINRFLNFGNLVAMLAAYLFLKMHKIPVLSKAIETTEGDVQ